MAVLSWMSEPRGGGKGYKASCSHASKKHDLRPDQTRMTSQYCFTTMAVLPQQSTLRSVRAARSPSRHASQNHELSSQRKRTTNTDTSSVTASMTVSLFDPTTRRLLIANSTGQSRDTPRQCLCPRRQ
ncbi:hypothetical protein BP00DRAFT_160761 [Aspergillus indologenus CBS 114.80]|uniref:Uncharacterized protein n=1 Tax=Aspergillus indologenus CBS 114.80 TaxID=1450541 RepID=A0A2V5IDB0_9EURO|nr:hypothetical protein BP00DRAFT_160761 [Aspergillus indologenus CBS 114.80]